MLKRVTLACGKTLKNLRALPVTVSQEETVKKLFEGINPEEVNFSFVFHFGAELLTHLGIAFQNQSKSGGTPYSVTEFMPQNTDELLKEAAEEGPGNRQDSNVNCPFTDALLDPRDLDSATPILSHIIPNVVHDKPDSLKFISMLAGTEVVDFVVEHLNSVGNIMTLEWNASQAYDDFRWAIQAKVEDDGKVTYIFRKFMAKNSPGPGFIKLKDGDEIQFGQGEAKDIGGCPGGPLPALCNLQYAVARVLRMSGAADMFAQLKDDADDSDLPNVGPMDFANILTAKLLLNSGRFPPP